MTNAEDRLRNSISDYKNKISDSYDKIAELEKQLCKYEEGLLEYRRVKKSFDVFMDEQKDSSEKLTLAASAFRFMKRYSSAMTGILTGTKRQRVENTFLSMENKIKKAIEKTENDIEKEKRNINRHYDSIDSLQRQLNRLIG